jgi:hypothetical protein
VAWTTTFDASSTKGTFVGVKFDAAGGVRSPAAARWNSTGWSATPGFTIQTRVTAFAEIGGEWLAAADEQGVARLFLWNGTSWVPQSVSASYAGPETAAIFEVVEFQELYVAGRFVR